MKFVKKIRKHCKVINFIRNFVLENEKNMKYRLFAYVMMVGLLLLTVACSTAHHCNCG